MDKALEHLQEKREKALIFYSPYNFLKGIDRQMQFKLFIKDRLVDYVKKPNFYTFYIKQEGKDFIFLYEYLKWDSEFLKRKCFKLFSVLYEMPDKKGLELAISSFKEHLIKNDFEYGFIDIPAEDIYLIQNLTKSGFQLIETRLHFFKDNLQDFNEDRHLVRKAFKGDLEIVGKVAKKCRNDFDRLHADSNFKNELADKYLEVYAKAAIDGFCDTVLLPADPGLPVDSFLAISHLIEDSKKLNTQLIKIVLTAVGKMNRGWHKKMVSETVYYAKEMNASYVLMTTQSTNRAVFRTCEKLNFKLGGSSHILSFSNKK